MLSTYDPMMKLVSLFNAASNGDKSAQAFAGMIMHEAGRETMRDISLGSDKATLLFLAIGQPGAAGVTSAIGLIADGALSLDDIISGNTSEGLKGFGIMVAGFAVGKAGSKFANGLIEKGMKISVGKNGMYYSLGRSGTMKTRDGFQALLKSDIASSKFGDLAPEVASQLLKTALKAFDEMQKE